MDESTTAACSSAARADGGRMRRSLVKLTSSMIQEMYVSAVGDGIDMDGRMDGHIMYDPRFGVLVVGVRV